MTSTRTLPALLSLALVASLACSKTADTAPERRIFGSPPTIQTVGSNFDNPQATVSCDFSTVVQALLCVNGIGDAEPQAGLGWTKGSGTNGSDCPNVVYASVPSDTAGTFIKGTYTELTFSATVTDPETTAAQNNILLVSASFVTGQAGAQVEKSVVLFDDGSQIEFPLPQQAPAIAEACDFDPQNGLCNCQGAQYVVKSGDPVKGDNVYSRKFALTNSNTSAFLNDCIMRSKQEAPVVADAGTSLQFKIEAVDRQGNIASWPTKLTATVGTGSFACDGDSCGCCLLHAFSQQTSIFCCHGEQGMISPSLAPNGVCIDVIPAG